MRPPEVLGRAAKVAKLAKERAKLEAEAAELESVLSQMGLTAAAPTKTGSDAEILTARQRAEAIVADRLDNIVGISPAKAVAQIEAAITKGSDIDAALTANEGV